MNTEVMDTPCSGNTKEQGVILRSRSFQFTINEIEKYKDLIEIIKKLKNCDYYISCLEEAPTTGHKHIHLYTHFSNPYRISKKILDLGVHIEICKGSPKQNIEYIEKDGNILDEWGNRPKQGMRTVGELKKIKNPDDLNYNEYNTWRKIQDSINADIDIDDVYKEIKVYYIFGPSGIGKSLKAKDIVRENKEKYGKIVNYVKYSNNFWINIGDSANIAIYDEFRDSSMPLDEFINFIDYNIHPMNIKGGYKQNNYKLIIITSVQNPKFIYPNAKGEPREQWLRRMEIIDMRPKDNDIDIEL